MTMVPSPYPQPMAGVPPLRQPPAPPTQPPPSLQQQAAPKLNGAASEMQASMKPKDGARPVPTLYLRNLNEKIKMEGKWRDSLNDDLRL